MGHSEHDLCVNEVRIGFLGKVFYRLDKKALRDNAFWVRLSLIVFLTAIPS